MNISLFIYFIVYYLWKSCLTQMQPVVLVILKLTCCTVQL